jgi:hypothetical protein
MKYKYTDENGKPILECPECGTRWDVPHGITLTISVNGMLNDHDTMLDADGTLVDVDNAVENGYHSHTSCGDCGEMLINMPTVVETSI